LLDSKSKLLIAQKQMFLGQAQVFGLVPLICRSSWSVLLMARLLVADSCRDLPSRDFGQTGGTG
jgi:hypothetical protein